MAPADPLVSPGTPAWEQQGRRGRLLLWGSVSLLLVALGVLGFLIGRGTGPSHRPEAGTAPVSAEPRPPLQTQVAEGVLPPPEGTAPASPQPDATSPPEGGVRGEATAPETPVTSPVSTTAESLPAANPRELLIQVAGEPALRVDATYEPRGDNSGSVTGFLVRGTVANPTQSRVERAVLTFTATGAIVVSQAAYDALVHSSGSARPPPVLQPYWNREVILAYHPTVLSNLAPGETRPFELVAATNLRNPPGLRPGEVVQAGQPIQASLLVRVERTAPSGAPVSPLQRP